MQSLCARGAGSGERSARVKGQSPWQVKGGSLVTFATPVAMPGAVSISMDPTREPESFYADGIEYYVINNNQGYEGDLELAMIPEAFRTDILKEEADANQVLVENANSEIGSFALLLSLMEISERSGMCFITVLHPVRPLNPRPMRKIKKYRQKH